MTRRLNLQLIELALTLSIVCGQAQETPSTSDTAKAAPPPPPPPLLAAIFPNLESEYESSMPGKEQTSKRPQFVQLLLERLEDYRTADNYSLPTSDRLSLTLQDASSNTISLEFTPNTSTVEQAEAWNCILNLLADTLAQVIQKAEQQGYMAHFKYTISLDTIQPLAYGPGLSANALKSAAG